MGRSAPLPPPSSMAGPLEDLEGIDLATEGQGSAGKVGGWVAGWLGAACSGWALREELAEVLAVRLCLLLVCVPGTGRAGKLFFWDGPLQVLYPAACRTSSLQAAAMLRLLQRTLC